MTSKRIGLTLGGGGARGLAQIGVIKAFQEANLNINCVAGTSIGALVGGFLATRKMPELESYFLKLKRWHLLTLFDLTLMKNGFFRGKRILKLLKRMIGNACFEEAYMPYAAVATDLKTGNEVILKHGSIPDAIRASISIPGVFTPVLFEQHYLIDGGIVNPLPVNATRDLGADVVIALDISDEHYRPVPSKKDMNIIMPPKMNEVVDGSTFIKQKILTDIHLEKHPADLLIPLQLGNIGFFDFHKGKEMIDYGYEEGKKAVPKIKTLIETTA